MGTMLAMNYNLFKRYDAWFVDALQVLVIIGGSLLIAMGVWCLTTGHGSFTGAWSWKNLLSLNVKCKW